MRKKAYLLLGLLCYLCFSFTAVFAQTQYLAPTLSINYIKPLSIGEHNGEEIYLIITTFSSNEMNEFYTVPGFVSNKGPYHEGMYPTGRLPFPVYYWKTRDLDKLKNFEIWKGYLKEDSTTKITINVMERDMPPWNLDNEFGAMTLVLKNKNDTISKSWENQATGTELEKIDTHDATVEYVFLIKNGKSQYQISFNLASQ